MLHRKEQSGNRRNGKEGGRQTDLQASKEGTDRETHAHYLPLGEIF